MRVEWNQDDLLPVVQAAVDRVLAQRAQDQHFMGDQLAYTLEGAARALGVTAGVIETARRSGKIRGVRLGKQYLYPRAELLRLLNEETP